MRVREDRAACVCPVPVWVVRRHERKPLLLGIKPNHRYYDEATFLHRPVLFGNVGAGGGGAAAGADSATVPGSASVL